MKTQRLKSVARSAALLCATALGTTALADNIWNKTDTGVWSNAENWTQNEYNADNPNWVFDYNTPSPTVTFNEMSEVATGIWVENTEGGTVTFSAESNSSGLNVAGDMHVGGSNYGLLKIAGGGYTFNKLYVAYSQAWWENPVPASKGKLTVEGGEVTVNGTTVIGNVANSEASLTVSGGYVTLKDDVTIGGASGANATLTINGGELVVQTHKDIKTTGGTSSIVINDGYLNSIAQLRLGNENTVWLNGGTLRLRNIQSGKIVLNGGVLRTSMEGGFFDASAAGLEVISGTFDVLQNTTPLAPLFGSGTLTKTGSATLTYTDELLSNFRGKINVTEGSLVVGETTYNAPYLFDHTGYVWTGAEDNVWSNVNNWLFNGAAAESAPAADSNVTIPEGDGTELTIKISNANEYTGYLTINRNVKFVRTSGDRDYYNSIYLTQVSGSGTLTLEATGGYSSTDRQGDRIHLTPAGDSLPFQIDTDLVVNGRIRVMRNGNVVPTLTLNGALKGTGYLYFNNYHNGEGARLNGDTSEFAGVFEGGGANGFTRDATKFSGDARGSELASWKFGRWDKNADATYGYTPFLVNNVTYQFGQLTAPLMHFWRGFSGSNTTGATVEVGALAGKTSTVTGSLAPNNTLRKVGATSTLEYTNAGTANGTVLAYEGTTVIKGTATGFALKFEGTDAAIKIARSKTTTTVVTPAVADDPETEEDETVEEVTETTTTTYIPSSFKPGFIDALVGCQYEVAQETTDGVTYDVYTVLTDVATDSAGTTYDSVALAIAAIEADETGTLTKAITLAKSTTEAVTLPLGYSLALNGKTVGSVAGAAGVGVAYDEATQTWTTADNSEATWTGEAGDGLWETAGNWSKGYVPDAGTAVTFTGNATVFLADNNTYDCGSIYISKDNATVTFAPVGYNESNWPRVKVYGNIGAHGDCVLKLYRCGIDNGTDGRVTVRPTLQFYNTTGDSWFTGNFDLQAGLNGTGEFRIYSGTIHFATGSGITVADGSVVDFRNYYPTFEGRSGTLYSTGVNGDGRIIVHALPTDSALTYFQNAFKNAERWSGTLELAGLSLTSVRWLNQYGNANSTVSFNNTTTYLYTSQATTGDHNVGIEVASGGLTIGGQYSSGDFVFPGKLTGTGTLTVAITGNNNKNVQFRGDCSEFAGKIAWTDGTVNTRVVVGDDTSAEFTAKTIVVNEDATIGLSGFGGTLVGGGTVLFKAATGLGTFGEAWTGVAVADFALTSGSNCELNSLGTANSVVANGQAFTGHLNGNYSMVPALRLDNDFTFNNGSSSTTAWPEGKITKFARILGDKNLNITWDNPNAGAVAYYAVEKIDGSYTGTINVSAKSALRVGEVALSAEPEVGVRLASIAVTAGGALVNADTESVLDGATVALTVAGEASEEVAVYDTDGLYVAVAKVGDDYYATYEDAAAAAEAAVEGTEDTASFTVLYGDGVMNGWDYDSEEGTLTKNTTAIARVGTTNYDTLAEAFAAATADDTVVLFGASEDAVALAADGATLEIDTTASYTGALSGDGTVVADADFTPTFNNWTGTFVIGWHIDGGDSGTAFPAAKYGNNNSTVRFDAGASNIFFTNTDKNGPQCHTKLYLASDVSIKNGWGISGTNTRLTTFPEVTIEDGVTFSLRDFSNASGAQTYFAITKLVTEGGKIVVPAWNTLTISEIVTDTTSPYLALEKNVNGTLNGLASVTVNGEAKALCYSTVNEVSGLYDAVAKFGDNTYDTFVGAIDAAKGSTANVVELLSDTAEGYTFVTGDKVAIKWNGKSTGDIVIPRTDALDVGGWNEETGTTTYDIRPVVAYITVGETVTPKLDPMSAMNDFLASPTGATLRFVGTNPFADQSVPCTTYDAGALTYTKLPAVAKIGEGVMAVPYPTLAAACAAAEKYDTIPAVTLLVARDTINETTPEGWEYNTPEASGTEFGTLTKASGQQASDGSGNTFTVDVTLPSGVESVDAVVEGTGVSYAQAYALGIWDGTAEGDVGDEPAADITINADGTVTVTYGCTTARAAYTVTAKLYARNALGGDSAWSAEPIATAVVGSEGATLADPTNAADMPDNKFYQVKLTIVDKSAE